MKAKGKCVGCWLSLSRDINRNVEDYVTDSLGLKDCNLFLGRLTDCSLFICVGSNDSSFLLLTIYLSLLSLHIGCLYIFSLSLLVTWKLIIFEMNVVYLNNIDVTLAELGIKPVTVSCHAHVHEVKCRDVE